MNMFIISQDSALVTQEKIIIKQQLLRLKPYQSKCPKAEETIKEMETSNNSGSNAGYKKPLEWVVVNTHTIDSH
ncbi:MAG: hypothetical protein OCD01_14615 [Fibrobacterales bacterium]